MGTGISDRADIHSVIDWGLLAPRTALRARLAGTFSAGVDAAATLLARHKVARIAFKAIGEVLDSSAANAVESEVLVGVRERLARHLEPIDTRMASSDKVLQLLLEQRRRTGIQVWAMKGFVAKDWYPGNRPRDVGDLDLLVPDIDSAWRLVDPLLAGSYTFHYDELPWFKGDVSTGALYGQVLVVTPANDALSVDVHAGPYSVRHCARMPLQVLESPDATPHDADTLPALGPTDNLCCLLGNAAGDCFVDAKTVNDLWLALAMDIDVDRLHSNLDEAGLLPFFRSCIDRVEELCQLDEPRTQALACWRLPGEREEPTPYDQPDGAHRLRVTVEHARGVAARLAGGDPGLVERIARSAEDAYSAELLIRLVDSGPPPAGARLPELVNWNCVRLIPPALLAPLLSGNDRTSTGTVQQRRLSRELSVLSTSSGDLMAVRERVFVPTVDFAVPRALAAEAVRREAAATGAEHT